MAKPRHPPFALALAVLFLLVSPPADDLAAQAPSPLDKALRWLNAVEEHRPGELDAPVLEVADWPTIDIETSIRDVKKLAAFLEGIKAGKATIDSRIRLYDRAFDGREVQKLFGLTDGQLAADGGNAMLRRGALLHADVAILAPDDFSRRARGGDRAYIVEDGRNLGSRPQSAHWAIGRSVLAAIAPSPARDPLALLWYRAVSAYLLRSGMLSLVVPHLAAARAIFPSSWEIALDGAYLHQRLASPQIQAAVQALNLVPGMKVDVLSAKNELEATEKFFRQVIALRPDLAEPHVRLGHVLGALGRHDEAADELRRGLSENPERGLRYDADLFLAREEEARGHRDEARALLEEAATLYPRAQSARLALSQLARQSGNRSEALRAIQQVVNLPADEAARQDPWWSYFEVHVADADVLLGQLRAALRQ